MVNVKEMNMDNISEVNSSFYEKYNPQIRAVVARILNYAGKSQDIEDCVNIVYLELMEKLQQYNEVRGSLAAFVAIVARSTALDYCRSNARKTGELIGDNNIDFLAQPIEFEEQVEFEELVESIVRQLNKKERALFTMRYILFYPPEEIAKTMKIRRSAVDMRVSRLRSKIKSFLIKGGITL